MEFEFKDIKYDYGKFKVKTNKLYTKLELDTFLNDRYTKEETYNKNELNSLITTPNVQYMAVTATEQTTDAIDVLPTTGAANTIYRVGNWNNSQFDASVYSEYAWNGSQYIYLSTKTQIGEVFDISAYHATGGVLAKYINLAAALDSNNGGGVPQSLQRGGMSVKFVQIPDNKYVQFRFMLSGSFTNAQFVNVANWQGIDEEPTAESRNLVESGGVYNSIIPIYNLHCDAVGNGTSLVVKRINEITKGNKIRFYIPNYDITGLELTDSNSVFSIGTADGTILYSLTKKNVDDGNIPEYVDKVIPDNGYATELRFRSVVGHQLECHYFDLDYSLQGIYSKLSEIEFTRYHTAYFTNGQAPTFTFDRLNSFLNIGITFPNATMYLYQYGTLRSVEVTTSDTYVLNNYEVIVLRKNNSIEKISIVDLKSDDILLLGNQYMQISGALALYVYADIDFKQYSEIKKLNKDKYLFAYFTDASKPDFYINDADSDKKIQITLPVGKTMRLYSVDGSIAKTVPITSNNSIHTIPKGSYLIYKNDAFSVVHFTTSLTDADYILLSYSAVGVVSGLLAPYFYDYSDTKDNTLLTFKGKGAGSSFVHVIPGITKAGLYRVYIPILQIDSTDITDSQTVFSVVFDATPQPNATYYKNTYSGHPEYVDIQLTEGHELKFRVRANSGSDFQFNVINTTAVSQGEDLRFSVIEKQLANDNIIIRNPKQIANIYAGCNAWRGYEPLDKKFALLVFTDLHGDADRMNNALYLLDNCEVIDAGLFLGDLEQASGQSGTFIPNTAVPAFNAAQKDVFAVIGNHDQRQYANDTLTIEASVSRFMGAMIKVSSNYQARGYGYKDFADYKIRIIMLNPYDYPDDKDQNDKCLIFGDIPMYQQAQINWLISTLNSVPEDYTVLVAAHFVDACVADNNVIPQHINAYGVYNNSSLNRGDNGFQDGSVISDIINAYKNKTTLVHSYNYISRTLTQNGVTYNLECPTPSMPSTLDVNADFSNAEGTFACYLYGHIHKESFCKMSAHNDQIAYGQDASHCWRQSTGYWTSGWSLTPRNKDSITQDLLNVFCVDTKNKMINVVRIGATTTMFGEKYEVINFSYA